MRIPTTGKILKSADMILAGVLVLVALLFFVLQSLPARQKNEPVPSSGQAVVVEIDGRKTHTVPFSEITNSSLISRIHAGPDREAVLEILSVGKVRIKESTCPGKFCVNTGWISRPGQAIVCLPYRIVVRIESYQDTNDSGIRFDAITY
ncbi:MAG: NusG domain II-containing protein [Firmicutes bacterium]|jgi:hypothetical protein|nr:NusG domain II-containing protein [Bacillota bacterium]